jgi:hypothetical protein
MFIENLNTNHKDIMARLAKGELDNEISGVLRSTAAEVVAHYKK